MKGLVCHLSRLRRPLWRLPWRREPNPSQQVEWSRWLHRPSHVDAFADEKTHPSMGKGEWKWKWKSEGNLKGCDVPKWCRSGDVSSDWRVLEVNKVWMRVRREEREGEAASAARNSPVRDVKGGRQAKKEGRLRLRVRVRVRVRSVV